MNPRVLILPIVAVFAVALVLGIQLASGGTKFVPAKVPTACTAPPLPAASTTLDPLVEATVLSGVQRAACSLGVTRERLLLSLPSQADRQRLASERGTTEQAVTDAVKTGMITEVRRLDRAGRLPPASALIDTYAAQLGLSAVATAAVKNVPSNLVDGLLPTGGVLERAIGNVDLGTLLNLDDPDQLEPTLRKAVMDAAVAEARSRLLAQVPDSLRGLLGG